VYYLSSISITKKAHVLDYPTQAHRIKKYAIYEDMRYENATLFLLGSFFFSMYDYTKDVLIMWSLDVNNLLLLSSCQ
jgi:hypothetical protein